jgi:UDP-N-acetylmuramoyl-L-alanyl-D-glutamate--2,6-diaminopimelate ligase
MLEASGEPAGLIGTIEYKVRGDVFPASHTTPESLELNGLLRSMVEHGCTAAVMEVSSHALHQHRVDGLGFRAAVFTNLTQDHLDYHATMEEYAAAKRMLFTSLEPSSFAIVNADDPWGSSMAGATRAQTLSYGTASGADVKAGNIELAMSGTNFTIRDKESETEIASPLIGRFNVSNTLAAFATGLALGIARERMVKAIAGMRAVRGRFETYSSPGGWTAVIDYAHTPDALAKALAAVKDIMKNRGGRIITLFGCGGNRDRTKRPKMGAIAAEQSDLTIVTSDNPRHEDPLAIIEEVMAGIPRGAKVEKEADRGKAIARALSGARKDDVVLIAGKGHEEYQVVGDERIHFSDREVVEEFIRSHA